MLSLYNISKGYGGRTLFEKVTLTLNPGERLGLVGQNGHGKTTLLNIIAGLEEADEGDIIKPKDYKIAYLTQNIKFQHKTVLGEAVSALPESKKFEEYLASKILFGLGFDDELIESDPTKLSGGYQVRLNLAKMLISEPNLMLLDEPTNYLDIVSIRWLEGFLNKWKNEIIFVTHDRSFMDRVSTHIAGIHRKKVKKLSGDTEKYYNKIAEEEETYEKTRINEEIKIKDIQNYIRKYRAKANLASRVQSRVKLLEKMDKKERLAALEELDFKFNYKPIISENILKIDNISFGYKGKLLINNLSFTVSKGEKIAIIGKNGAGKSTLLRIIAGGLTPNSGRVERNPNATVGYFEQTNITSLNPNMTIEDEIAASTNFKADKTAVRNICATMLFSGDDALKKISVLSGGEKCRVLLGKIISNDVTYLLLDEPTNHLDMDASQALMEALEYFEGAVVFVTHNESYLYSLATKLIIFQGEEPFFFDGTYEEFLNKIGWEKQDSEKDKKTKNSNSQEIKRMRAKIIEEKSRKSRPIADKIAEIEMQIISEEERLSNINKEMDLAINNQDGAEIARISIEYKDTDQKIAELYDLLNDYENQYSSIVKEFDTKIEELR